MAGVQVDTTRTSRKSSLLSCVQLRGTLGQPATREKPFATLQAALGAPVEISFLAQRRRYQLADARIADKQAESGRTTENGMPSGPNRLSSSLRRFFHNQLWTKAFAQSSVLCCFSHSFNGNAKCCSSRASLKATESLERWARLATRCQPSDRC